MKPYTISYTIKSTTVKILFVVCPAEHVLLWCKLLKTCRKACCDKVPVSSASRKVRAFQCSPAQSSTPAGASKGFAVQCRGGNRGKGLGLGLGGGKAGDASMREVLSTFLTCSVDTGQHEFAPAVQQVCIIEVPGAFPGKGSKYSLPWGDDLSAKLHYGSTV